MPPAAPVVSEAMADASALSRIDAALARIEAAAAARDEGTTDLRRRHEALRKRMAEVVSALDQVIAREEAA